LDVQIGKDAVRLRIFCSGYSAWFERVKSLTIWSGSDTEGRNQRHDQNAGKQLLATSRSCSVIRSGNLTVVQKGHRNLIRELSLW
jgi:hypothetical protein